MPSLRAHRLLRACVLVASVVAARQASAQQPPPQYPPPQGYPPPQQGYPPQGYPQQYPPQQYPPRGYPQQYPPQQYPPQYPPQQYPPQGYPPQYPPQQYPPQQYPPQQYPPQGYPQQYPPQQYPPQQPPQQAPQPQAAPEPDVPTHAPKFALYVGGRINYMGFGNAFYQDLDTGNAETTGRLVGNGPTFQIDIGARLAKAWIPYFFAEYGLLSKGGYFEGTDASARTTFVGGGLRHLSGDPDSVTFIQDLSVGLRAVSVARGEERFTMSTFEWVRLGLGAEIRLHTRFTLSPLASISAGAMNDAKGTVGFNFTRPDAFGIESGARPKYSNSGRETVEESRPYIALMIGCGFHFDLLGD